MFRCQISKTLSKPREVACRLVTAVRPKRYYRFDKKSGTKSLVGEGMEIASEVLVTKATYEHLMSENFTPKLLPEVEDDSGLPESIESSDSEE